MPEVPSIAGIFKGADWLEREVYDLFGIRFAGHPYMVRLMLPEGWTGHPLRKDYDSRKEQFVGLDAKGNDIVSFRSEDGW
jgi:NADH-quinone oxidoreductase subunit C